MTAYATQRDVVCGIDIGSTNVKVILIDENANTLWTRSMAMPRVEDARYRGDVGTAKVTDATRLVAALEEMMSAGWREIGASAPLAAIAVTGVGEDGLPVNAQLRPLDCAIPWFDHRASALAGLIDADADARARAGVRIDSSRTAAKWCWLREHRPHVMRDAAYWLTLTDYASAWWAQTPFISETLAARTACYDVFARRWMAPMLAACGAPPLPPVLPAGAIVGTLSAGSLMASGVADANTLIVAGGHDHPIAASAVKRLHPDAIVDSLGTANLLYDEIDAPHGTGARADSGADSGAEPDADSGAKAGANARAGVAGIKPQTNAYLAFSVPVSGRTGIACLGVFEFSAALAPYRGAGAIGSTGTPGKIRHGVSDVLQSYLTATDAAGEPGSLQNIEAALASLSQTHSHEKQPRQTPVPGNGQTPADSRHLRLTLEAAGLYARCMYDAINEIRATNSDGANGDAIVRPIYAVGGWARSQALLQIRSSIFGQPVFSVDEDELTALGVALFARDAFATSRYGHRNAASAAPFFRDTKRCDPDPVWRDAYQRRYLEMQPVFRGYANDALRPAESFS